MERSEHLHIFLRSKPLQVSLWNFIRQSSATLTSFNSSRRAITVVFLLAPSARRSLQPADWKPIFRSTVFRFQLAEELCEACTINATRVAKQNWSVALKAPFWMSLSILGRIRRLTAAGRNSSFRE